MLQLLRTVVAASRLQFHPRLELMEMECALRRTQSRRPQQAVSEERMAAWGVSDRDAARRGQRAAGMRSIPAWPLSDQCNRGALSLLPLLRLLLFLMLQAWNPVGEESPSCAVSGDHDCRCTGGNVAPDSQ